LRAGLTVCNRDMLYFGNAGRFVCNKIEVKLVICLMLMVGFVYIMVYLTSQHSLLSIPVVGRAQQYGNVAYIAPPSLVARRHTELAHKVDST
jgi:hypothetical protein